VTPFFHHWNHSDELATWNTNYAVSFPSSIGCSAHSSCPERWPSASGCDGNVPDRGYVAQVLSRNTVIKAEAEVVAGIVPADRLRAPGGGDKPLIDKQPGLLEALDELVHPDTRGNPMSLLRWTSKSSTKLAAELVNRGFDVSSRTVLRLLHRLGYSLQANVKVSEGRQHPDRDAQFGCLNDVAARFIGDDQPAISVDTKKKELIGDDANGGGEWSLAGEPERVQVHGFADRTLGEFAKAIPYGIDDVANNEVWVSVGDVADVAEFAVESIRRWWNRMGRQRFPPGGPVVDHRGCRRVQRLPAANQ